MQIITHHLFHMLWTFMYIVTYMCCDRKWTVYSSWLLSDRKYYE